MGRNYEGFIFDLDGTLYLGEALLPGAGEVIARIRERGKRVVYVSNKPLEPRGNYAAKLTRLGIVTTDEDVTNSTRALVHYLKSQTPAARLFVIGEEGLRRELAGDGFYLTDQLEEIDIVVASFDRTLDYAKLNTAHQALVRGARFLATNGDATCPFPGGPLPDCAGVIAFLEATTGRKVELIAGKPSELILEAALKRLSVPRRACLMVGDRLTTDILMGIQADMDTALMLTGVTARAQLEQSDLRPTYVLESLHELLPLI